MRSAGPVGGNGLTWVITGVGVAVGAATTVVVLVVVVVVVLAPAVIVKELALTTLLASVRVAVALKVPAVA